MDPSERLLKRSIAAAVVTFAAIGIGTRFPIITYGGWPIVGAATATSIALGTALATRSRAELRPWRYVAYALGSVLFVFVAYWTFAIWRFSRSDFTF
ncbi:MAG TPA: hypothetical protein VLA82_04385 [Actinomycetota bacterium]|nr:hypothetical protein [Actinomycetota bacterium]